MTLISRATSADFAAILELQNLNHLTTLPEKARGDGFLTTYLDLPKLERLAAQNGLFVAKNGDKIAGYVCTEAWDKSGERGFHNDVLARLPFWLDGHEINAGNSRLYGPVCVASAFRGQNVLAKLVEAVKTEFGGQFSWVLTFIDFRNARSLAAHERKLGFRIVGKLPYDETTYHVLAFPL